MTSFGSSMSRSVTRLITSSIGSPCFCSSATYSLLYSVPVCGGFDLPSVVTVVRYTLPPVTMGDDQPRPGISRDHSTFSVFDQRSASRAWAPTGFDSGPRNCGHATFCACTASDISNIAHMRPAQRKSLWVEICLGKVFIARDSVTGLEFGADIFNMIYMIGKMSAMFL